MGVVGHPYEDGERLDVDVQTKVKSADVFKLYKDLYPDSTAQNEDHYENHYYDIVSDPVMGKTFVIPSPEQTGRGLTHMYGVALEEFYRPVGGYDQD